MDNGLAFVGKQFDTQRSQHHRKHDSNGLWQRPHGHLGFWNGHRCGPRQRHRRHDHVTYQAVVLNVAGNQAGTIFDNSAEVHFDSDPATAITRTHRISPFAKPKSKSPSRSKSTPPSGNTTGDAGDPVQYTIVIQNTGSYDAFDVTFSERCQPLGSGTSAILGATFSVVDSLGGGLTKQTLRSAETTRPATPFH